jgi:hypothetical protein
VLLTQFAVQMSCHEQLATVMTISCPTLFSPLSCLADDEDVLLERILDAPVMGCGGRVQPSVSQMDAGRFTSDAHSMKISLSLLRGSDALR